jgi:hypothetical protein
MRRGRVISKPNSIATDHDDGFDGTPDEIRESSYRRGVHHGFTLAMEMVERGFRPQQMQQHEQRIHRWRYRQREFETTNWAELEDFPVPAAGVRTYK